MSDLVVTVPRAQWNEWLAEGDLPGDPESEYESHFTFRRPIRAIEPGERVYVVAHDRLRGYAPLVRVEQECSLYPGRSCLVRRGGAVAVTLLVPTRGFRGYRKRWWDRSEEVPFPAWRQP